MIQIDARATISEFRFAKILQQCSPAGECLLFKGHLTESGYGRVEYLNLPIYVHRAAYAARRGPIPEGMNVCHRCDVPNCIADRHLFLGTDADNVADMLAKGRGSPPPIRRGEANGNTSISDDTVAAIRATAAIPGAKQRDVAAEFNVSQSTVWRHLHKKVRS